LTSAPSREVPSYDAEVFAARSGDLCIGIPVINEGDRIRRQLERMRSAGIDIDIVIADGGSTDGSLQADFLRSVGVRGLLTKRGPGKLSAQMRMFFDWALTEGYDSLILMDGNDKDGLDGLFNVRHAIEDGYDFVQASRYRPGGRHANTPLDRELGVRLLHAPLLSLAARFRYTDTTNGLRGYSRRFLLDPRVDPFRDVFDTYNLHYYLSVRAPRLGYRVLEVPAERNYPEEGHVPSKIGGFRARLHILRLLAETAAGRYNPPMR
jgi:dolichol-phosphate mannosyltransferase